jgi:hypothetical protein
MLMPGGGDALQHRDHDRDHGRGQRGGAGKAEMDQREKQRHRREDEQCGRILQAATDHPRFAQDQLSRIKRWVCEMPI